ncbi:hypothetical protein A5N82_04140 [Christensenella minuta]|nr:hypothetical protein B1H56_10980 [Christensenella minuta]OAQ42564.1 hypothetical protein A5N82_04140 [Christensenella minuta]
MPFQPFFRRIAAHSGIGPASVFPGGSRKSAVRRSRNGRSQKKCGLPHCIISAANKNGCAFTRSLCRRNGLCRDQA